jgi:hypothetical protein
MDVWHSLWFLRPLIVLVMACPFLIFPALLSLRKKHRAADNDDAADHEFENRCNAMQDDDSPHRLGWRLGGRGEYSAIEVIEPSKQN